MIHGIGYGRGVGSGRSRQGFTLVELLVVVAIITVLLALLVPALSEAKAESKSAVCKSNLRQIALADHMYAQDNDGLVCVAKVLGFQYWMYYNYTSAPAHADTSKGLLSPYLNITSPDFFKPGQCPVALETITRTTSLYGPSGLTVMGLGLWGQYSDDLQTPRKISDMSFPAETVIACDTAMVTSATQVCNPNAAPIGFAPASGTLYPTTFCGAPMFVARHGLNKSGGNVAWGDGHVSVEIGHSGNPASTSYANWVLWGSGYLSPEPLNESWATFSTTPQTPYYFWYNKDAGFSGAAHP